MCPPSADAMHWSQHMASQRTRSSLQAPATPAPTILIVDDDPVIRSLMRDTLEDEGFAVDEAEDGVQASRHCDDVVPSLIVVDAVMPNMDGFELCRGLRR